MVIKSLDSTWGNKITKQLMSECKEEDVIINLVSNEYRKSFRLEVFF